MVTTMSDGEGIPSPLHHSVVRAESISLYPLLAPNLR